MPQIANKMLGNHSQGVRPYQRTRFATKVCLKFKIQEVSKRGKLKANFLGKFKHCVQQQARSFQARHPAYITHGATERRC